MDWYFAVLRKYAVFSGRARRREFWMFVLVNLAISIVLSIVDSIIGWTYGSGGGPLGTLYSLAVLIPTIAVSVRRLHDTGRTGWWILVVLVPFLGWLVLLYFYIIDGERGPNKYGPDPKADERGYWTGSQPSAGAPAASGAAYGTGPAPAAAQAAAAWYADPAGRHQFRYWDGRAWTEHVADNGVAAVDPLAGPQAAAATVAERPAWPSAPAATVVTAPTPQVTPAVTQPATAAPSPAVTAPSPSVDAVPAAAQETTPATPSTSSVTAPPADVPEGPKPPDAPPSSWGSPPSSA